MKMEFGLRILIPENLLPPLDGRRPGLHTVVRNRGQDDKSKHADEHLRWGVMSRLHGGKGRTGWPRCSVRRSSVLQRAELPGNPRGVVIQQVYLLATRPETPSTFTAARCVAAGGGTYVPSDQSERLRDNSQSSVLLEPAIAPLRTTKAET